MLRIAPYALRALAALAVAAALTLAVGYLATASPDMPRTVVDDPSLPQVVVRGVRLHVRTCGDPASSPSRVC